MCDFVGLELLGVVDLGEEVDMLLLLPRGPDEVDIRAETLFGAVLPPVTLLEHALHNGEVVARADIELLRLVNLIFFLSAGAPRHESLVPAHVCLDQLLREVVCLQDRLVQQVLHLNLHIQDELPTVEELSEARLRVKLFGDGNVDLLGDLLELYDSVLFHEAVGRRAIQRTRIVSGCDGLRVLVVLEDEADDVVDRVDGLVDLVLLILVVVPLVEDVHFAL